MGRPFDVANDDLPLEYRGVQVGDYIPYLIVATRLSSR